jgi:hypothetical protein
MQQRAARLVIVTFAVLLSMPLAATIARIGTETPSAESSRAGDRQHGFFGWLDYFDTHFGFRQQLVHAHAFTSIRTMNISPSPAVIKGRDGWLYYADDDALEDYESATPMSEAELRGWANTLVSTRDVLRAHGIAYLFVLAPDKHVIYPEHLPESIHRVRPTYRMDELLAYLRQHTDLSVLDLRPALIARKQVEQVYFRTDTHWNDAGAFAGYRTSCGRRHVRSGAFRRRIDRTSRPSSATSLAAISRRCWASRTCCGSAARVSNQECRGVPASWSRQRCARVMRSRGW